MNIINNPKIEEWEVLARRPLFELNSLSQKVEELINDIKVGGDKAIKRLTKMYDGVTIDSLRVSLMDIDVSDQFVNNELKESISIAIQNITKFHKAQKNDDITLETMPGVKCTQKSLPIRRVGLYIPGGSAPLFSTLMMLAIPAKLAGCEEIIICTPPEKDGSISPIILYVAKKIGITDIYKIGGAQAIAALAFGSESVKRVDKIFGPGNQYVSEAKSQLSKIVAIDLLAGPSEVLVIADETAIPEFVAADMLAQAEHGADSQVILLTTSAQIAAEVNNQISQQLKKLARADIAAKSLLSSKIIVFNSNSDIIEFTNQYAPEHLIIATGDPWSVADKIKCAGSVFIGNYSPESVGDYASGTNHTLPTSGWAKSVSGVGLDSFMHKITYQEITKAGLLAIGPSVENMALNEGLDGHQNAVTIRLKYISNGN